MLVVVFAELVLGNGEAVDEALADVDGRGIGEEVLDELLGLAEAVGGLGFDGELGLAVGELRGGWGRGFLLLGFSRFQRLG